MRLLPRITDLHLRGSFPAGSLGAHLATQKSFASQKDAFDLALWNNVLIIAEIEMKAGFERHRS
jgi:hypothetical protein